MSATPCARPSGVRKKPQAKKTMRKNDAASGRVAHVCRWPRAGRCALGTTAIVAHTDRLCVSASKQVLWASVCAAGGDPRDTKKISLASAAKRVRARGVHSVAPWQKQQVPKRICMNSTNKKHDKRHTPKDIPCVVFVLVSVRRACVDARL